MSLTLSYVEIDFGDAVNETPEEREARLIAEAEAEALAESERGFREALDDKVDSGANSIWRKVLGGSQGFGLRPRTIGQGRNSRRGDTNGSTKN